VLPVLSSAQRAVGRALGSASAVAGSEQSPLCPYRLAELPVGVLLTTVFGWYWAGTVVVG
jgi:hypothetical protein